jgi:hypothetical protein
MFFFLFQVKIQLTGFKALTGTIHYLYGCRWCDYFKDLSPKVLLELVILTDKYLLLVDICLLKSVKRILTNQSHMKLSEVVQKLIKLLKSMKQVYIKNIQSEEFKIII